MRLIVGLGNPDPDYSHTPHNLGFAVVERLAEQARLHGSQRRGRARVWRARLDQTEVVLAQPLTYMNASGPAVAELLRAEGLTPGELIVISDDVALPWGTLRIRERGSSGGHKGLESVIAALGTNQFLRVRLGVRPLGPPETGRAGLGDDLAEYVLTPISPAERGVAEEMVAQASEAVRVILREGPERAMARFNRRATPASAGA